MNTASEKWSIHCMDVRGRWWVMTTEGWQSEQAETKDGLIVSHDKLEAAERIRRTLADVGWVFGVRMQSIPATIEHEHFCWCGFCGFVRSVPPEHTEKFTDALLCPDCEEHGDFCFLEFGSELPESVIPDDPMEEWKP